MQNIRLSINVQKLSGVRILRSNNHAGDPTNYVAIPLEHFFIPRDQPSAHLMLSLIPSPKALYGDFIVKPYIDHTTYESLTPEQRKSVPIVGKGTYQKQDNQSAMRSQIEATTVEEIQLSQNAQTLPSPSEARSSAESHTQYEPEPF